MLMKTRSRVNGGGAAGCDDRPPLITIDGPDHGERDSTLADEEEEGVEEDLDEDLLALHPEELDKVG